MPSVVTGSSVGICGAAVVFGATGSYLLYRLSVAWHGGALRRLFLTQSPESEDFVDQEIAFHFGDRTAYAPYIKDPSVTLSFAERCAVLCEKYTLILQDFTGEQGDSTCLDIGCSIGATTIELSKSFVHVMGVDPSPKRIQVAEQLKEKRIIEFEWVLEGMIKEKQTVTLDTAMDLEGIRFRVADPVELEKDVGSVDCVLAAMTMCRLSDPKKFLSTLPKLVKRNGTAVLVSSYDWHWKSGRLGGDPGKDGKLARSEEALKGEMEGLGFQLLHEENIPCLRRHTERTYQWIIAHATVWRYSVEPATQT